MRINADRARTTTVPRLNGPATAGTTIDSPNGAPLYGPVRNTGACGWPACGITSGFEPSARAHDRVPNLRAPSTHGLGCRGSPHNGTLESIPNNPCGRPHTDPTELLLAVHAGERQLNGLNVFAWLAPYPQ